MNANMIRSTEMIQQIHSSPASTLFGLGKLRLAMDRSLESRSISTARRAEILRKRISESGAGFRYARRVAGAALDLHPLVHVPREKSRNALYPTPRSS